MHLLGCACTGLLWENVGLNKRICVLCVIRGKLRGKSFLFKNRPFR